jgi:4-amino-4-deoxy-L-arabinose transferase-like glycosyltransferase
VGGSLSGENWVGMFKSSILNLKGYQTYLKSSRRSYWSLVLVIFPASLFAVLSLFETEIAAWVLTLYPPSANQGFAFYLDLVRLAAWEVLWLGFFFLLACVLMVYPSKAGLEKVMNRNLTIKDQYFVVLILSVFFVITLFISADTLEQFANSSDEYAYLFQAEMFSRGKLWAPAHDLPDFFYHNNIPQHDGILVSRFSPGWPLFLSAAFEAGIPAYLINPVLAVLTLIVFYFFACHVYGDRVALWSLGALAFTGFYIFNAASFFSHVLSLLVTLLFVCNLYLYHKDRNFFYGLLAGFFLGFAATINEYNVFFVFIPLLLYLFYQYRFRAVYLLLLMAVGAVPFVIFLLSYNYSITGDPLLSVTGWTHPLEKLGFVKGHNVVKGLEHAARWILLFFYWASPGLLILYFVFLYRKMKSRTERFLHAEDYFLLFLMIGYFFYHEVGGNQYGPRFLFEGFAFLILFVVSKVFQIREKWAVSLLLASLIYAVVKFPFITHREAQILDERQDLYDLVEGKKISNAVVLVSSATSPKRPMPADDLTRNDPKFQNDVIFALELPTITTKLMEYYNDRSFYRYVREPDNPQGELIKIK